MKQGNPEGLKVWVNTELGMPWEERGERIEEDEIMSRREMYDAQVPDGVLVLTAGIDTQDDRFEIEIVGWGIGKESWGIRYQKIFGDMLGEQVWRDLDMLLQTTFYKRDGTGLRIAAAFIDSGGHHSNEVYAFTKQRWERRVWALKGKGGPDTPYLRNPTKNNREKTPLFIVGVDNGKALLYQRLRVTTEGPNYCHFPLNEGTGYDEAYFKGLTSEKMVVRFRKGRAVTAWEIVDSDHKRNEPLDCRNYAQAVMEAINPPQLMTNAEEYQMPKPQGRRRISGGI